jgi:hypothetical protein
MPEPAITSSRLILPEGGRQTRIDFPGSEKSGRGGSHLRGQKKGQVDWWHSLTGWLRASKQEQDRRLEDFRQFLLKENYSKKTCASYVFMLRKFFGYLDERKSREITFGDIEDYNYEFFVRGRYSRSYQLQFINALTLYLHFADNVNVNLKGLRKSSVRRSR